MSGSTERRSGQSGGIVVLLVALISSAAMAGVIAAVQLIIYPSFIEVSPERFVAFHEWYSIRIGWIVGVLMPVELIAAVMSTRVLSVGRMRWLAWLAIGLVGAIWVVTALVQVPQHGALSNGYDALVIESLVVGNWTRFWLWQAKAAVSIYLLVSWIKIRD